MKSRNYRLCFPGCNISYTNVTSSVMTFGSGMNLAKKAPSMTIPALTSAIVLLHYPFIFSFPLFSFFLFSLSSSLPRSLPSFLPPSPPFFPLYICGPGCPRTCYAYQADLQLTEIHLSHSSSARNKGVNHHAPPHSLFLLPLLFLFLLPPSPLFLLFLSINTFATMKSNP